ncbi:MAG TPA: DUF4232 domain-containing protein [Gaiellaceae bacterium]|nr:DUF4232 domain-containing protein [Gaiellaceae bacterium]
MRATLPIVLLVLALATACDSGSKQQRQVATGPAVPWIATVPPQLATRTPAKAACRSAELTILGQVRFIARLQGAIALVTLQNTGKRACRLRGRPSVGFVKRGGPKQVQRQIPPTPSNFPEVTYPESSLLALRPGERGAVTISWLNWCDPVVKGVPHVPPSALRLTLPGGRGHLDADYNAVPPCLDPRLPSTIGVSRFQPSLVPPGRFFTNAFLEGSVPSQPVHGRRGRLLRFRVVLKNRSHTPATFERCPAYIEQLAPAGRVEAHQLNCAAAHPIAPGKSVAFGMRLRVPRNAPLGANGLFWELDPFGSHIPQLHARVTING